MTRFYKSLWFVSLAIIVFSCSDDEDPLPRPTVDFRVDPAEVEVGIPVMFDNLSTNAARYEWDFGDGSDPITDISPSITFTTPGSVTVTLRAFTQDEQVDSVSREVVVKERVLTGVFVNVYPDSNNGTGWDPDETGVDSLADIIIQLLPLQDAADDEVVIAGPTDNLESPFSLPVDPSVSRIVLTDEDWVFTIFDFDGEDIGSATQDDFEPISGAQFNPVQAPTVKNDAGDAGFISIQFFDQDVNGLVDLDLSFRLE